MTTINGKIRIETKEFGILEGYISLASPLNSNASRIVAYNDQGVVLTWQLIYSRNDSIVYESGKQTKADTCIINLNELNLSAGSVYKLKAVVSGRDDKYGDIDIVYNPTAGTIYFGYDNPVGLEYRCDYYGNVNSLETPPVLKCSSFLGYHEGAARMRWNLKSNGVTLISSGVQTNGDKYSKDFSSLNIASGTRITVKANVVAGSDSTAFVVLEYDPTSPYTAITTFSGNAFKTMVMLSGIGTF